ncbi:MAG: alpha/beta hydrolase [Candidatus Rokubacteria bacterium]|nr:alpha/beta hydrolase [Candidatus Rokubacteria bacterium]
MAIEIDVQDVEYVRHATGPLLARVFTPRGAGPFPLIVDLHGGAWCRGDRTNDAVLNEPLARSGVVVVALDFRMPPVAGYPASMADINYAIRWLKSRAADFDTRSDMIGVMGISSGGHQGMLNAMRPRDPRYTAIPLPGASDVDASVRCAILCWPVIDPLGRYQYAKNLKAGGAPYPEVVDRVLPAHDLYWPGEDAMAEASPVRVLERGERVELPPVLYIQGTKDQAHPRPHLDRFVELYRKAGGQVELELLEGEAEGFISKSPVAAQKTIARIIDFVHKQLG